MKNILMAFIVTLSFHAEANDITKLQNAFYRATLPDHADMVAVSVYQCKFIHINQQAIKHISNLSPGYKFVKTDNGMSEFWYENKAMKYSEFPTTADYFSSTTDFPYIEGLVKSPYIWRQLHYTSEYLKKISEKVLISEWNVSHSFLNDNNLTERDLPRSVYSTGNKPFAFSYTICAESLDAAAIELEKILK